MKKSLQVLVVEDSDFDAQMMVSILRKGGYDVSFERVETADALHQALTKRTWQIILADYNLPDFSAPAALRIVQESGLDLPFIIVSGGIGEDVAVGAMKAGAHDYVMKGNLHRLVPAVERELREAEVRASQREAKQALQESEMRHRLLWETCPDAVILMDTSGTIHFANPAVQTVFGYTPEEATGMHLRRLQPQRLQGAHASAISLYMDTGIRRLNWRATETVGLRKDGVEIPIELSYADIILKGERLFVGFVRDISERKRAERELRENQEQFRVAREIQQRLFPKAPPALAGYDLAGATYPAEATGGDYFDYLQMLNWGWGIVVADVAGHGIGPALLMAETRAYLRLLGTRRDDPGEILSLANSILAEDVGSERFVTLFLGRLAPSTRILTYASAGHHAAYILDRSGTLRLTLPRTGIPLGLRAETRYMTSAEFQLEQGDLLLVVTDGIVECMSPADEIFGDERLLEVARRHREKSAREIVESLYQAVRDFAQHSPQIDDVTAIVLKVR